MNRHDGGFHFRYWTSKTDQYTKSYPDFSLGGTQIVEHSLEDKVHSLGGNIIQKTG